ncbi:MAG: ABC transporter ATP-binding protein, partial [Myxococcota bacterium]|nr:ABC transporter ATP-binding protein [Myxococcota bacterium]
LLWSDFELAALSLLSLPLLLLSGRWMGRRIYELSRLTQDRLGKLSDRVQENLGGVSTIRTYQREEFEIERFEKKNTEYFEANVHLAKIRGVLFPVMGLFGSFGSVILLYLGGQRVISGQMTVGEFVEFGAYLNILIWPTIALGWMIALWQRGMAAMERINEIFMTSPDMQNGGENEIKTNEDVFLELRNLSFAYPNQEHNALQDIDVSIKEGEFVVVVGRTGSGKSTFIKILTRLLPVAKDKIFFRGIDYNQYDIDIIRKQFAYAPQEAFLFSRSIRDNIRFSQHEAKDEQVDLTVERAGLHQDLSAFSNGLDTLVGERGVTLSGGQRQRTTLARALMNSAPILVLDDTLSAVDNETEATILKGITGSKKQTTILVTHRLTAASMADRILVLEDGKIVEQGTEKELLQLSGTYAQLYEHQRKREQLEANNVMGETK